MQCVGGGYVTFVDGDDWIESDWIQALFAGMKNNAFCIGGCTQIDSAGRTSIYLPSESIVQLVKSSLFGYASNKLYLKRALEGMTFAGDIREDIIFNLNLLQKHQTFSVIENSGYFYFQHGGSILHNRKVWNNIKIIEVVNKIYTLDLDEQYLPQCLKNIVAFSILTDHFSSIANSKLLFKEKLRLMSEVIEKTDSDKILRYQYADNWLYRLLLISVRLKKPQLFLIGCMALRKF